VEDINRVELRGRVARDAEFHLTQSQIPVTSFVLATTRTVTVEDGALKDFTDYHRIAAWRNLANHCADLRKGDACHVVGRLTTRTWTDGGGFKRYMTEVNAASVEPLDLRTPVAAQVASVDLDEVPF